MIKLKKGINYDKYKNYLNWDIKRATYSKKLIKSVDDYTKNLCELTLKMQREKSKKIYNELVAGWISKSMAIK